MIVKALLLVLLPFVVFNGGVWMMNVMSGREYLIQRLEGEKAGLSKEGKKDYAFLNFRFCGYDAKAAKKHWELFAKDDKAVDAEKRFLEIRPRFFRFFTERRLLSAYWIAWAATGRTFNPAWILLPVALAVIGDWTENLIQLNQFQPTDGEVNLDAGWIRIANIATMVKNLLHFHQLRPAALVGR